MKEINVEEISKKYLEIFNEIDEKFTIDNEKYHGDYDYQIECLLRELGLNEIADRYNEASEYFWYA